MSSDIGSVTTASPQPSRLNRLLGTGIGLVLIVLVAMWFVEGIDAVILNDRLEQQGIQPRTLSGLDGVLWSPFLHGDFGHLLANTLPFAVLGGLVAIAGRRQWVAVTVFVGLIGGSATWLLARSGNHIGASGIVFGYLGYLLAAALIQRRPRALGIGLIAAVLYGGLIFGVLPRQGVSWEGHLFGLAAGVVAALATGSRTQP